MKWTHLLLGTIDGGEGMDPLLP